VVFSRQMLKSAGVSDRMVIILAVSPQPFARASSPLTFQKWRSDVADIAGTLRMRCRLVLRAGRERTFERTAAIAARRERRHWQCRPIAGEAASTRPVAGLLSFVDDP
jgi:hypothetical protein